jgi:hypothetical protein
MAGLVLVVVTVLVIDDSGRKMVWSVRDTGENAVRARAI